MKCNRAQTQEAARHRCTRWDWDTAESEGVKGRHTGKDGRKATVPFKKFRFCICGIAPELGVLGVRRDIPEATKQCWLLPLLLASHQNSMALPIAKNNTHFGHGTQRNQADIDWEAFSCLATVWK